MGLGHADTTADPFGEGIEETGRALRIDRVLVLLFIVLSLGGTALVLVRAERQALDDPVQKGARGEVRGLSALSLLREANLRPALAKVQARLKPDEQLTNLRLDPTRLDIQVRDTIGHRRSMSVGLDGKVRVSEDPGTDSSTGPKGLGGIDPSAPARMLVAVRAREGYPPERLNYLVYDGGDESSEPRWDAFYVEVPVERNHLGADAHGRLTSP